MKTIRALVVLFCMISIELANASSSIVFNATPSTTVSISRVDRFLNIKIFDAKWGEKSQKIDFDVESSAHLDVADLGFGESKGFLAWYVDEGMGAYTITQVFIYLSDSHAFTEIHPACANEFVNLRIDTVKHELISTFYEENEAKLCRTKVLTLEP